MTWGIPSLSPGSAPGVTDSTQPGNSTALSIHSKGVLNIKRDDADKKFKMYPNIT